MEIYFRKKIEIFFLRIAVYVLYKRNLKRCLVISRRDNNELWYMHEKVESIIHRINNGYNDPNFYD